ncbi:2'-5'-oligoadenylate [Seminavis robusta]|uniref:2'-5'-oligoadenylate n=1 Tax=Seminavis robusta TaxID=568900 RepID=A0A9N8F3H2_9STRA|nr:2'-5'-oligoadenylate [Seminavis robusta]|eukprot:Sro3115_g344080.1 2'-5'-oligoadenylate (527) ;mRNA; r:4183-5763
MELSYAYDHFDPRIQNAGNGNKELCRVLGACRGAKVSPATLRRLGDELAPTKPQKAAAQKAIDQVVRAVQSLPNFGVDRCCVSGSFGKGTALRNFDIDLVLFLNNEQPPFTNSLRVLTRQLPPMLPGLDMEMTTPYSVQFCLDGFNFDLLPAPNFTKANHSDKEQMQYKESMKKIAALDEKRFAKDVRYWGPALAESTVKYMKSQPPFVNAAVRLAKLWKKACAAGPHTFPRWFSSFVVEIIASEIATRELTENPNNASLVRVLTELLKALTEPHKLCIIGNKHRDSDIPLGVKQQRPLVLDPVNPTCNLAKQLRDWASIRLLAASSLKLLQKDTVTISELFQPQLSESLGFAYRFCSFRLRSISASAWIQKLEVRTIRSLNGKPMNPGVEWRSRDRLDTRAFPENIRDIFYGDLHDYVHVCTTALLWHTKGNQGREVAAASAFVDDMLLQVFGQEKCYWRPTSETHDSKDVTFTFGQVPIPSPKDDLRFISLKLSVDLKEDQLYRVAYEIQRDLNRQGEDMDDGY